MNPQPDLSKPVKLKHPQPGEENIVYRVTSHNKVTRRVYIRPVNMDFAIPPQELVSVSDIENV
jgi:hypothetical protein